MKISNALSLPSDLGYGIAREETALLDMMIVEDNLADADRLQTCLKEFASEHDVEIDIQVFRNPQQFLYSYKPYADIVFLDIEMPGMNGLELAHRLRKVDSDVILFFVTNMVQYGAKGYEVAAFDYIVKPLIYSDFERKLERAVRQRLRTSDAILVTRRGEAQRLLLRDIMYIEVRGHALLFHTDSGEVASSGTLQDTEAKLSGRGFLRSSKSFLVNYRRIASVKGTTLLLDDGQELTVGRVYRKEFMQQLADYIGDGNST